VKGIGLQLAYTAKTQRPTYRQLSSNVYYANRLSLQTGNPLLKPTVTHDVSLSAAWSIVQLMASYKMNRDAVIYWTVRSPMDPKVSLITYRNLDRLPAMTIYATVTPTFGPWTPQLSAGLVKQWAEVDVDNETMRYDKPLLQASLSNSLRLPAGLVLSLDLRYQGTGDYENVHLIEKSFYVNAGLTRSFFHDRLRVELKGWDIFRGRKDGNQLRFPHMTLDQFNRYDTREFELTLRYKFNAAKSKYKGTGAGTGEINRL